MRHAVDEQHIGESLQMVQKLECAWVLDKLFKAGGMDNMYKLLQKMLDNDACKIESFIDAVKANLEHAQNNN